MEGMRHTEAKCQRQSMDGCVCSGIPSQSDTPPIETAIITSAGILYLHSYICSPFMERKNKDYLADTIILKRLVKSPTSECFAFSEIQITGFSHGAL